MTIDDAVTLLEGAGLAVSHGEEGLVAAADFGRPHARVQEKGVAAVAAFGFSLRKIGSAWFLRHGKPPARSEQFLDLDAAVVRALAIFENYQRTKS